MRLLWVCSLWRNVALAMPDIWLNVRLCTWTSVDKVNFMLERIALSPFHVEINTEADILMSGTHKSPRYAGLVHAAKQAKQWRSITIISSPPDYHIESDELLKTLPSVLDGSLEGLQSLKINTWHDPVALLTNITFPHDKITDMELNSQPSVLYHFMQPQFIAIFHALIIFKVDVSLIHTAVDILTQFQQLETLDARGLFLPTYPVETNLQLVHTLKYMKINNVSVQWMAGRIFHNLKQCEIIQPLHPEMIVPGCCVNLPVCTKFTYDNNAFDTLPNFCIPTLDTLTIRSTNTLEGFGSGPFTVVWSGPSEVALRKPRILHLKTQCDEQHLIEVLTMLPELEELHLDAMDQDRLGQMFFTSLQAEEKKEWETQEVTHICKLCPSLKSLSIRYSFWVDGTPDTITPLLDQLVMSRQQTATVLTAKFWIMKRVQDHGAWASPLWVPDPTWGSPLHGSP